MNELQERAQRIGRKVAEANRSTRDTRDRSEPEELRRPPAEPAPRPTAHLARRDRRVAEYLAEAPSWEGTCGRCGGPGRRSGVCVKCADELGQKLGTGKAPAGAGASLGKGDDGACDSDPGRTVPQRPGRVVDGPTARRRFWAQAEKPTDVVDPAGLTLYELLERLRPEVRRVILTRRPAESAGEFQTWALGDVPEGWEHGGHYLPASEPERAVLRLERWGVLDGRAVQVEVHQAGAWFGKDTLTASARTIRAALGALGAEIEAEFPGARLLSTPATTGRDLWHRSIPDEHWQAIPRDLQALIRDTSGQGRIQFFQYPEPELPGLCELDGRMMYAGLTWGLGAGSPIHDEGSEFLGHRRGRYRVTFRVPEGWTQLGLLGVKDGGRWEYPSRPGEVAETWADGAELQLAEAHGWEFHVRERLIFPEYRGAGPLDSWTKRLLKVRDRLGAQAAVGALEPEAGQLAQDGVRSIILHGLGAFVGRDPLVTCSVPIDQAEKVPAEAQGLRAEAGRLVWSEPRPVREPGAVHPEWSAAVWARCRVRMLSGPTGTKGVRSGALHLPEGVELLGILTDALYLTQDPGWPDDGKVGRLRVKATRPGPLPTPATALGLIELKRGEG